MDLNLVSVIIPSYNNCKFIESSIESALNQTYKNIEIIVIDDNSKDGTVQLLQKYSKNKRVKIVNRNFTDSIGRARNDGIRLSKGNIIAFLDSDDFWQSDKIEKQLKYLGKYDLICTNASIVNLENVILEDNYFGVNEISREIKFTDELKENLIITSSVILKKSLFKGDFWFPEKKGFVAEDYYFWLKLMSNGCSCFYISEQLVFYRKLEPKFELKYRYTEIEFIESGNKYRSEYLKSNDNKIVKTAINNGLTKSYFVIGINYYRLNERKKSLNFFKKVLLNIIYSEPPDVVNSLKYIIKILMNKRSSEISEN